MYDTKSSRPVSSPPRPTASRTPPLTAAIDGGPSGRGPRPPQDLRRRGERQQRPTGPTIQPMRNARRSHRHAVAKNVEVRLAARLAAKEPRHVVRQTMRVWRQQLGARRQPAWEEQDEQAVHVLQSVSRPFGEAALDLRIGIVPHSDSGRRSATPLSGRPHPTGRN